MAPGFFQPTRTRLVFVFLVGLAVISYLSFASWYRDTLQKEAVQFRENYLWAIFQTQTELLTTLKLSHAALSEGSGDVQVLRDGYDLLISRISIVRNGDGFQELREVDGLVEVFDRLHETTRMIDETWYNDPTISARTFAEALIEHLGIFEVDLQRAAVNTLNESTRRSVTRSEDIVQMLDWLQVLFVGNLIIIGIVVTLALRQSLKRYNAEFMAREEARERRYVEESMERSKLEALGVLAGGVAHEINTPAQFVQSNLDFLKQVLNDFLSARRGPADEAGGETVQVSLSKEDLDYYESEVPEALDQANQGIVRITNIVQAIKRFAHPDSGARAPVNVRDEIANAVLLAENQFRGIATVELDIAENLPDVEGLSNELNQVLINLLVNSVHAIADARSRRPDAETPAEPGMIKIHAEQAGNAVRIAVEDNGPGIPDHIASRIFDPFFTTKPVGVGSGQGLAISRRIIVSGFHGSLELDPSCTSGARFVITLPSIEQALRNGH